MTMTAGLALLRKVQHCLDTLNLKSHSFINVTHHLIRTQEQERLNQAAHVLALLYGHVNE